jgi:Cytotoxic
MSPIPDDSFLHEQEYLGFKHGSRRWRSSDGDRLYTWDDLHEHVEGYNPRGAHIGVFDAVTGIKISDPVKGRKIDV